MDGLLANPASVAVAAPRFWSSLSERCANVLAGALQPWRGTSMIALGESFSDQPEAGKSSQVVQRLRRLNPALRVRSHCGPSLGLLEAGEEARRYGRRSFDAALVFIGPSQLAGMESQDNFTDVADRAVAAIARVARRSFVVSAFDAEAVDAPGAGIEARRRRWLERTLQDLCARHGVAWLPLVEEEGCIAAAATASFNFSVDGFRSGRDPHEMWTARMLQQPALAQLVFH